MANMVVKIESLTVIIEMSYRAGAHDHLGYTGAIALGATAIGAPVGLLMSPVPTVPGYAVNLSQGEEDSTQLAVDDVNRMIMAGMKGGAVGATAGYVLPKDWWSDINIPGYHIDYPDKVSANVPQDLDVVQRRRNALVGGAIGSAGTAGAQALVNLIYAFQKATPEQVEEMVSQLS